MNLTSCWKLTFNPGAGAVVLLNYGDEIEAEPYWPLRKPLKVLDIVDSPWAFLKKGNNKSVRMAFKVFSDEVLDKDARRKVMESLVTIGDLDVEILKVEIQGITDRFWRFNQAGIEEHVPYRFMDAGTARVCKGYTVTAVDWEQVGPA